MRTTFVIASIVLQASVFAQERDKWQVPPIGKSAAQNDAKQEMIELFGKVETRLNEIDRLLYDAGAGETRLPAVQESGIADLLRQSKARSEEVLVDIDRILEIARQAGGT